MVLMGKYRDFRVLVVHMVQSQHGFVGVIFKVLQPPPPRVYLLLNHSTIVIRSHIIRNGLEYLTAFDVQSRNFPLTMSIICYSFSFSFFM
jgi:hypothetical protein